MLQPCYQPAQLTDTRPDPVSAVLHLAGAAFKNSICAQPGISLGLGFTFAGLALSHKRIKAVMNLVFQPDDLLHRRAGRAGEHRLVVQGLEDRLSAGVSLWEYQPAWRWSASRLILAREQVWPCESTRKRRGSSAAGPSGQGTAVVLVDETRREGGTAAGSQQSPGSAADTSQEQQRRSGCEVPVSILAEEVQLILAAPDLRPAGTFRGLSSVGSRLVDGIFGTLLALALMGRFTVPAGVGLVVSLVLVVVIADRKSVV